MGTPPSVVVGGRLAQPASSSANSAVVNVFMRDFRAAKAAIRGAEGERAAAILRAEGQRQAYILEAEGKAEAIASVYNAIRTAKTMLGFARHLGEYPSLEANRLGL